MFNTSWSRGAFVHSVQTVKAHDETREQALARHLADVEAVVAELGVDAESPQQFEPVEPAAPAAPAAPVA